MKWLCHSLVFWSTVLVQSCALAAATSTLPASRILQFDDYAVTSVWTHVGGAPIGGITKAALKNGTNHFHSTGWRLLSCRTGTGQSWGREVAPASTTNLAANLQNTLGAQIESPVFSEGIGTLYFEAINNVEPTQITVEWATNMVSAIDIFDKYPMNPPSTNGLVYDFIPLEDITLNAASLSTAAGPHDFVRYVRLLNYRQPAKIRIRRSGSIYTTGLSLDEAVTVIDNIRLSAPPSDVSVYKTNCPFEPGYPAINTNFTIRCLVDNVDPNAQTESRTNRVVYRWRYLDQVIGPWKTNLMTRVDGSSDSGGNHEVFEAVIPAQTQVGDIEYYFTCNFDGNRYIPSDYTGLGYAYPTESLSPRYLRGSGQEFYTRLRPFKSQYGAMYMVWDEGAEPVEMALTGDDEWRGMVPVRTYSVTNASWYFKATNAYVQGATAYETNTQCWGEQAQIGIGRLPYGGFCALSNETARIRVTGADGGFVQTVFNSQSLSFMASRAEYQNFNAWPAPDAIFSDSSGQDPRRRIQKTFDDWTINTNQVFAEYFLDRVGATNVFSRDPFLTNQRWMAGRAAYAVDRTEADANNKPSGYTGFRNQSIRLRGGDGSLGLGYIYNTGDSLPDGVKNFTFKARLAQSTSNSYDVAFNRNEFTKTNYVLRATVQASLLSPEQPSLSLIIYYRDPGNFYEYRMTQIPDTTTRDQRLKHQIFKWVDGFPVLKSTTTPNVDSQLATPTVAEVRIFNESATKTIIRCKYGNSDSVVTYDDTSAPYQAGTYGFLSADCKAAFSAVYTANTTTAAAEVSGSAVLVLDGSNSGPFDTQKLNWYTPAGRFEASRSSSPYGIWSLTPAQKVGVYLQASTQDYEAGEMDDPEGQGSTAWHLYNEYTVPAFSLTAFDVPLYLAQANYVMIQVMGGDPDVVVDELAVSSWHGKLRSDSGENNRSGDWIATEAWVVSNSATEAQVVLLDHSRAYTSILTDTRKGQAVRAQVLDTGMGLMEFDYRVLRAPAKLTVQYALRSDPSFWTNVQSFTFAATTTWQHASAYVGNNEEGFLRVLNEYGGGYTNAIVEINNAVVWDEPNVDATSWTVYNAKVTDVDLLRVSLDKSKTCFLNNSQTIEAAPIQDRDVPFVQSPALRSGLGTLTFSARAYTNNQSATVSIQATTNGWNAAPGLWFEIGRIENITNTLYQSYRFETINGRDYDAVRLATSTTNGARRVCVEELAAIEPIFPGFDIVNVHPLCKIADGSYSETRFQPLMSDDVGIEAQISNILLTPSNIEMFVEYYIGTNAWGVGNWPAGETVVKPMYRVSPGSVFFRTSTDNDIPVQEKNQVVQYRVWARYMGGIQLFSYQQSFQTPSWYFPTDLNKTYAAKGWSPYYLVYDIPPGAVWINEINATDYVFTNGATQVGIWNNPYIEIAVPAEVDLTGWQVELVKKDFSTFTVRIPAGVTPKESVTNGYAFIVIGEAPALRPVNVPALPNQDVAAAYFADYIPYTQPGGLRLKRPQGMYEQSVAYDWNPSWGDSYSGTNWVNANPDRRFVYVGREHNNGSLGVVGTSRDTWFFPQKWSPGAPNEGQTMPSAESIMPGVSNVLITSEMDIGHASQNGKRFSPYTLKLIRGASSNIIYQADNWYRISSVKVNQSELLGSGQVTNVYKLAFNNLLTNVEVQVTVGLREDVAALNLDPQVLAWLLTFGDAPLVTGYCGSSPLSWKELYWLNANPTVSNNLEFSVGSFTTDANSNVLATVRLALNGQNVTRLQGGAVLKLLVKKTLAEPEWTLFSQYVLGDNSFDASHESHIFVSNPFVYLLRGWNPQPSLIHKATIEMDDPRVIINELIDRP